MGEIARLRIIFLIVVHGDGDAPSLYTQNEDSERGIAELRIISLVEVHGDGDALPFIRRMRIPMGEISRLRINFPVEVHRDGDAPSLYTQNEDSERGKSQGCV